MLSIAKEEYVAAFLASCEVIWIQNILFDLKLNVTSIFCDNQIFLKLLENLMFHDMLKQIDIKYPYIWDIV